MEERVPSEILIAARTLVLSAEYCAPFLEPGCEETISETALNALKADTLALRTALRMPGCGGVKP